MSRKTKIPENVTLNLGDRQYKLIPFINTGTPPIHYSELVERASIIEARLSMEDIHWVLGHKNDIPSGWRRKIVMIATNRAFVVCMNGLNRLFVRDANGLLDQWHSDDRLVKRVQ